MAPFIRSACNQKAIYRETAASAFRLDDQDYRLPEQGLGQKYSQFAKVSFRISGPLEEDREVGYCIWKTLVSLSSVRP